MLISGTLISNAFRQLLWQNAKNTVIDFLKDIIGSAVLSAIINGCTTLI